MEPRIKRKSIRLTGYDYSQNGAYFVTICVKNRLNLLGEIVGAALAPPDNLPGFNLSKYGKIVKMHIEASHKHHDEILIDKYVIMPNHIHMIVAINTGGASAAPTTLGNWVRGFKAGISRECSFSLWQRSFHDYIIRNEDDYSRIWKYIDENPAKWAEDKYFVHP